MLRRTPLLAGLVLALLLSAAPALAQAPDERQDTEERLHALKEQIAQFESRLTETAQAEQASVETLKELEREIALRRELVGSYQYRLKQLNEKGDSLHHSMSWLEEEIGELREEYQRRAAHAYKYGRMHDLALILAARSINEMMIRVRYLGRFAQQRRRKIGNVKRIATEIEERRAALVAARKRTATLIQEAENEEQRLARLQSSRQQVVSNLRNQRVDLQTELEEKRTAAAQLEARIRQLVAAATAKRREREVANPVAAAADAAAFVELTGSFKQNRGGLPWPAQGAVIEPFGEVVNPVHGTTTPNYGLLLATAPSAPVHAVFEGEVLSVSMMPEFGTYVLISHGDYQSVYSNFSMVYVAEGDHVKPGQLIGRAGTDAQPKGNGVFFALFHDGQPFDPATWLKPR